MLCVVELFYWVYRQAWYLGSAAAQAQALRLCTMPQTWQCHATVHTRLAAFLRTRPVYSRPRACSHARALNRVRFAFWAGSDQNVTERGISDQNIRGTFILRYDS